MDRNNQQLRHLKVSLLSMFESFGKGNETKRMERYYVHIRKTSARLKEIILQIERLTVTSKFLPSLCEILEPLQRKANIKRDNDFEEFYIEAKRHWSSTPEKNWPPLVARIGRLIGRSAIQNGHEYEWRTKIKPQIKEWWLREVQQQDFDNLVESGNNVVLLEESK